MLVAEWVEKLKTVPQALAGMDHSPALRACIPIVFQGNLENFGHGENVDSTKWPPRKDTKDHPLMILSGALMAAASGGAGAVVIVEQRYLGMGVDMSQVPYTKFHHTGWSRGPKRQVFYLHGSNRQRLREAFVAVELKEVRKHVFGWT